VETWYEIREEAIDNILDATVMWLALREHNCFTPQAGGEIITRTIKYGTKTKQNIAKGKTLTQSVAKRETMAWWDWKHIAIDVNRDFFDDQKNHGPSKIKDYVTKRITGANEDIIQGMETDLFGWADGATDQINGLFDVVPPVSYNATGMPAWGQIADSPTRAAGTFGNISRTNSYWQTKTQTTPTNPEVNLRNNMATMFNSISDNVAPPNFMIADQDLYEYYEDEIMDKQQIARTSFNQTAADLGFETLTFKGKPLTWTAKLAATDKMFFFNLDYIEMVYDPEYFFDMTEWFTTPNQLDRVAYIISAMQLIDTQPRRHGLLDYNANTYS
jgi:hypothetical protein